MTKQSKYRPLRDEEIRTLTAQGCECDDWSKVEVAEGFDPERVRRVRLSGSVKLGAAGGTLTGSAGVEVPCGVFNASIHDLTIGDGVRIANVGVILANYDIGDGAAIENVGTVVARPGAKFGNGVEIEALNEGGGREITLFNRLDSQFAYLLCVHRYRGKLIEKLQAMAKAEAAKAHADRGTIGAGARIADTKRIENVNVGAAAVIAGAESLVDGTILSASDAPTTVGGGVEADHFIIAEGASVTSGAIVSKSFVGQGCQIGKQFSSEGSVFFANCEGFHGEACSIVAGPYTVTHHKSTLLIAGMFSFYNAGSGTNQSNHLYKLGPVHEGRLERGCKTGSFSYMMWPCRIGPFSVVLGKHTRTFDTGDFPFSYIEASPEGRCQMTPGFNLTTVGTVRDGAKWPARDRRKGSLLRDRITFDVFSPLSVGRMIAGTARMQELAEKTDRSVEIVTIGGAEVKRVLLRTGQKIYRAAVQMYLLEKIVARVEAALTKGAKSAADALAVSCDAVLSQNWVDIGGQMMPQARLDSLAEAVVSGRLADLDALNVELDRIRDVYAEDEWAWVRWAYQHVTEKDVDTLSSADLAGIADELKQARTKFITLVLNDASKEFGDAIRTGFGQDGGPDASAADFTAVRGEMDTNKFVKQMREEIQSLADRVEKFKQAVASL